MRRASFVVVGLLVATGCSHPTAAPPDLAPAPVRTSGDPAELEGITWPEAAVDWSRPIPADPVVEPGYSGSAACEGCHQAIYKSYARHAMSRTGLRKLDAARTRQLLPLFAKSQPVRHAASGFSYRAFKKGDQLFVEELLDGADGKRIHSSIVPVTHTFTSGTFGLALGFQRGGYVYELPIDWYPGDKTWGLDPAFVINGRFNMPVGALCIGCHSDYPRHRPGSDHALVEPLPDGVGCERCHGPGARHVESADKKDIVNPARLPPRRQLDVCGQCHLEGVASVPRAGRSLYSFRPGEPLWAWRMNYVDAEERPDEFQITGHSERLVRSACFKKSPALTCTSCHDPHKSSLEETPEKWRAGCLKCHEKEHPCRGAAEARQAAGDRCPQCHMRKDTPPGFRERVAGVSLPISDHWIRRRIDPPGGPAHLTRVERIVSYAELTGEHPTGDDLPAVHAVALRTANLVDQAVPEFLRGVAAHPRLPELYEQLGNFYKGQFGRARDPAARKRAGTAYRLARAAPLSFDPDDVGALMGYARAVLTVGEGDLGEAARALDRVLRLQPDHAGALEEKGGYLFRAGKLDAARPLLEHAAQAGPQQLQSEVLLGVMDRDAGKLASAAQRFEAARRIEPRDRFILRQLDGLYEKLHDAARRADVAHTLQQLDAAGVPDGPSNATRWLAPSQR